MFFDVFGLFVGFKFSSEPVPCGKLISVYVEPGADRKVVICTFFVLVAFDPRDFYVTFEFACALDDDGHKIEVIGLFPFVFVLSCVS